MENRRARNLGIMSFLPLILFVCWLIYYMVVMGNFIVNNRMGAHLAMAGQTAENYTGLFITLAIVSIVSLAVLLFQVWHVWTKTDLPAGQKVMWVLFLGVFWMFASPVYWYMHLRETRVRNNASPALS